MMVDASSKQQRHQHITSQRGDGATANAHTYPPTYLPTYLPTSPSLSLSLSIFCRFPHSDKYHYTVFHQSCIFVTLFCFQKYTMIHLNHCKKSLFK